MANYVVNIFDFKNLNLEKLNKLEEITKVGADVFYEFTSETSKIEDVVGGNFFDEEDGTWVFETKWHPLEVDVLKALSQDFDFKYEWIEETGYGAVWVSEGGTLEKVEEFDVPQTEYLEEFDVVHLTYPYRDKEIGYYTDDTLDFYLGSDLTKI